MGKSGKLKEVFMSRSPDTLAATTHVTALSPVAVPPEGTTASGMNYGLRTSVPVGSGKTHS